MKKMIIVALALVSTVANADVLVAKCTGLKGVFTATQLSDNSVEVSWNGEVAQAERKMTWGMVVYKTETYQMIVRANPVILGNAIGSLDFGPGKFHNLACKEGADVAKVVSDRAELDF